MNIAGSLVLKKGKEVSVKRFHPWVFSGAIQAQNGENSDGDWVSITDSAHVTLGYGHYHNGTIAARILSFGESAPSSNFYLDKIKACYQQRNDSGVISNQTNAYRLVNGEGDELSGLIIDFYNGVAVVQAHSIGMYRDKELIADALKEILLENLKAIYLKAPSASKNIQSDGYFFGMSTVPHIIKEFDNKFYVDWESGQKTGFFLDQRDNRKLLTQYCQNKVVLNKFCYTGGFSIYAIRGDATLVHYVDASEKAIELTRKNIELNGFSAEKNPSYTIDTFEYLKDKKDHYDVIILDPPAFAKHKSAKHQAMKGYQRLNAEAFRVIKPGGIIFTFSCSQVIHRQLFYDTIVSAAIQSGRRIKVLHHLSQPADHPVSVYHPEGTYLKGLVLYVE
ncbi:MAG: class I SAM-dependent rRNA methyltransferase [Cyclobacteriaceae bacterium]